MRLAAMERLRVRRAMRAAIPPPARDAIDRSAQSGAQRGSEGGRRIPAARKQAAGKRGERKTKTGSLEMVSPKRGIPHPRRGIARLSRVLAQVTE
jgi:hypothetical protein